MLEFALKQERVKSLAGAGKTAGTVGGLGGLGGASKVGAESGAEKKEGGDSPKNGFESNRTLDNPLAVLTLTLCAVDQKKSNGSSPNNIEQLGKKPPALIPSSTSRAGSVDSNPAAALPSAISSNPWKSTVSMPVRDPKSRARSRDYLKQYVTPLQNRSKCHADGILRCLQEISYLTSPAAMNPLPNRLPLTLTVPPTTGISPSASATGDPQTSSALAAGTILEVPDRPRKVLPDGPFPAGQPGVIGLGVKGVGEPVAMTAEPQESVSGLSNLAQEVATEEQTEEEMAKPDRPSLSIGSGDKSKDAEPETEHVKILTAIYKPESKEAWKQALRQANEQAEKTSAGSVQAQASDSAASDAGMSSRMHGS